MKVKKKCKRLKRLVAEYEKTVLSLFSMISRPDVSVGDIRYRELWKKASDVTRKNGMVIEDARSILRLTLDDNGYCHGCTGRSKRLSSGDSITVMTQSEAISMLRKLLTQECSDATERKASQP